MFFQIVNTDNFGGDYPNEKFVENLPAMSETLAIEICAAINASIQVRFGSRYPRHFKVVPDGYVLQPGFEP